MNKSKGNVIKDGQERNKNKQQAHLKGSYKKMKKMKLILLNLLLIVIEEAYRY